MGFFDRFSSKKPEPAAKPEAGASGPAGGVMARLATARERLDAKDLPAAVALYEAVLEEAGDRADVLVTVSGDLGSHGHIAEIIELIAPRYDAERHGPATGLNLLQAYLAARNADAAQHVLDILFGLDRPELEDRLHGFSNAIAEILLDRRAPAGGTAGGSEIPKVGLVTISKPIWFYGLESLAGQLLPPKEGRLRRIAFTQLALPGRADLTEAMKKPEDEVGRLTRALPLWFAEAFYFSPSYAPIAALGMMNFPNAPAQPMLFPTEWSTENLRQVVDQCDGGLDFILTGALRAEAGDYEVALRIWEVKTFRERKTFSARWTPATADAVLTQLHGEVRAYMEWSPASAALAFTPPTKARAWLDTLGVSLGTFLVEKAILSADYAPKADALAAVAQGAAASEIASLAWLTVRARAAKLGTALPSQVALARSPLVTQASSLLG